MRPLPTDQLIIATHNTGKLREFQQLLKSFVREIKSAGQLGLAEPEETGTTFTDNALLKAHAASKATGQVALADDSGLCVSALDGAPGIFSARWGGEHRDMKLAMQRVHEEVGAAADHSAHFMCVLALVWPDGGSEIFQGRCEGTIIWPPRGDQGHGYDPIFVPKGDTRTFAEMSDVEKNAISHRGLALKHLALRWAKKE